MNITVDSELIEICKSILEQNWDDSTWAEHESGDWFQSENYCGGFDETEMEFCFSFYTSEQDELWFQFPLEDVEKIISQEIVSIEACKVN